MREKGHCILVVDDDRAILEVLEARLSAAGYRVFPCDCGEQALELLRQTPVDLVVSDVKMPGMSGRELLEQIRVSRPGLPVVLLTAYGTIEAAVDAVKAGALDYMPKPFDGPELVAKIDRILESRTPAQEGAADTRGLLVGGRSASMKKLLDLIARVAPSDVSVLVTGESGTGKEQVARAIHALSRRADGPMVVVDCGATPANLLESELFGHVKGSFTHAVRDKKGLIAEAHGGTLFLDEIGNISHEMQTRLLRFLQERTIRPVGGTKQVSVDCRVVAATNADLPAMVREGSFREDLYYRLKVITLTTPPLRERREDIPELASHFLGSFRAATGEPPLGIAPETMRALVSYRWPGNVRELRHVMEAGAVLCTGSELLVGDLQLEAGSGPAAPDVDAAPMTLEESERRAVLRALEEANWVQKDAADLLGISRRAIHYKIRKFGIEIPGRSRAS